jgi:D-alanyl-D-alanine dipeptidase
MSTQNIIKTALSLFICSISIDILALPQGFVYLEDVAPNIVQDMRYASSNNFIGRAIQGYQAPRCILTIDAARGLAKVQAELEASKDKLIVFDCYRPTRAVADFIHWSQTNDQKMKDKFYPRENKSDLFERGYIAEYSSHSRASTVDLSIYQAPSINDDDVVLCYAPNRKNESSVDMGTNYDCLDPMSHVRNTEVSPTAKKNRLRLANVMKKYGFRPYSKEWWHFTLKNEPIKKTYFNFPVR